MRRMTTTGVENRLLIFSASGKGKELKAGLIVGMLLIAAVRSLTGAQPGGDGKNQPVNVLVLRGANIFDAERGEMLAGQTIIIRGERIEQAGPEPALTRKIPARARVIDARGKFIIPGLIDAHVHLVHQLNSAHVTGDEVLPMFLAAGVTAIRDVGDIVPPQKMIARHAEAHPESSPRVFMCSPLIDGAAPFHRDIGWALTDPKEVPGFVDDMAAWGVTTLKIYVGTERTVGRQVIQEGHKRGLMVTGHLGLYSAQDAVADGIDSLEHIWSVFDYIIPDGPRPTGYRSTMDLTTPKAQNLITNLAQRHVRVDPTLTIFRNAILLTDMESVNQNPDNTHAPARLQKRWVSHRLSAGLKPETFDLRRREFLKYQELTGILYRAGVTILAGTDSPEPLVPPGFSLLQELELLVESGLPPSAALQAATINNAGVLKQESQLGSISAGKFADLVILSANPLTDIRNIRRIEKVIRGGIICQPEQLLKLVPEQ